MSDLPEPFGGAESIDEALARLARLSEEAASDLEKPSEGSGDLVAVAGSSLEPVTLKAELAEARAAALTKMEEIKQLRSEVEARLDSELRKLTAVVGPLAERVRLLEEGIWTVNLYLGREEQIVVLATGERAPVTEPISVRQMVLSMDQESMIAAEHGGIDYTRMEEFDDWLMDPAHLAQVLPEQKGIVALVPRVTEIDYGDPLVNIAFAEENLRSYWLIRNGENLYRMTTNLNVGETLVPTRDEFTSFFETYSYDGKGHRVRVPLEPGTPAWLAAERAANARQRHYMRAGLVVQGLIDRTTVFAPLPDGVSLLRPESYDAGHVQIITDADSAIGTGMKPFYSWLNELNAKLTVGMRIVGAFSWRVLGDREERRIFPRQASLPAAGEVYRIDGRRNGGLVFHYDRTDDIYDSRHRQVRAAKKRAGCLVYHDDRFIIPFDLVTVEELEAYVAARTQRHAYLDMVPIMKAVIAAKKAEEEQEAPFRQLLAAEISRREGVEIEEAEQALPGLVAWWKIANRWHRPLVGPDLPDQQKAIRMIVAEFAARRKLVGRSAEDEAMASRIRGELTDVMFIGRRRDGTYVALCPASERDKVFVTEWTYKKRGNRSAAGWKVPGNRRHRWFELWSNETWANWDHKTSPADILSGPEIDELVRQARTAITERHGVEVAVITLVPPDWGEVRPRLVAYLPGSAPVRPKEPAALVVLDYQGRASSRAETVRAGAGDCIHIYWRRLPGGGVACHLGNHESKNWRSYQDDEPPWQRREVIVFSDEGAMAKMTANLKAEAEIVKELSRLSGRVNQAVRSVVEVDQQQAREEARRKYVDGLGTDEGFEQTFEKAYRAQKGTEGRVDALTAVYCELLKAGGDFETMTVGEAVALAAPLRPDQAERWASRLAGWSELKPVAPEER